MCACVALCVGCCIYSLCSSELDSYVSRETAEVGVAICIKPAEARNEAWDCWESPWTIHYQTAVHGTG